MTDLVAIWDVPLNDDNYHIEFEHGTITGKRVIRVNGKEIIRKDWMFKLVGLEKFEIGIRKTKCEIGIHTSSGLTYEYSLLVHGKHYKKFNERQKRNLKTWIFPHNGIRYRIVLEMDNLDVWINGTQLEVENNFVENGTEIIFPLSTEKEENGNESKNSTKCLIRILSSGDKREGIIYSLLVDGKEKPLYKQ